MEAEGKQRMSEKMLTETEWWLEICKYCAIQSVNDILPSDAKIMYRLARQGMMPVPDASGFEEWFDKEVKEPCIWKESSEGVWEGECGITWTFKKGTPQENKMNYCVKCGGGLMEIPYKEWDEER
jgi:hypothetical protein